MAKKKIESKEMLDYYTKDELKKYSKKYDYFAFKLATTDKWHTYNREILKLKRYSNLIILHANNRFIFQGETIAHCLAKGNPIWFTDDVEILMLKNNKEKTVAHFFALFKPCWCHYNFKILNENDIKFYLIEFRRYIATRIKKNAITIIPII